MARKGAVSLTEGNLRSLIFAFAWPVFLSHIFTELYNITNSMIVGNFVSLEALSAVSACTWICNIFNYTFHGLGMGAGILVARYYGAKDKEKLKKALDSSIMFAIAGGLLLTLVSELSLPILMRICNIGPDIYMDAQAYLRVYLLGNSAVLTSVMCFNMLRSFGDTKHQLIYSIITSIINVILGVIFVRVLHLNVVGTALATIISQFVNDILALRLMFNYDGIEFDIRNLNFSFSIVAEICALGIPAGIQNMLIAISSMMVQSYTNMFPNQVIAGIGVAEKVVNWAQMFSLAISAATIALVAQNMGAKNYERVQQSIKECIFLSTILTVCSIAFIWLIAPWMVSRFNQDPGVIMHGTTMIRYAVFAMFFLNLSHIYNAACRGAGNVKYPMIIAIIAQVFGKYLFVRIGLSLFFDVRVLYLGTAFGFTMAGILAFLYFHTSKWTKENKLRA